jgi:SAM-dependent methyltransferase
MRRSGWIRTLGASMAIDGLLSLMLGRKYIRLWRVGPRGSAYRRALNWLLDRPRWFLRTAGAAEAGLGLALIGSEPLEVRQLYGAVAGIYDAFIPLFYDGFYRNAHQAFDQALATHLPPGGQVLELGCGTGVNLDRLLSLEVPFETYVGVDLSEAMLVQARDKFADRPDARFQQLDLMTDPLPEGPFDLIVSTWVFEHLSDPVHVVEKAWDRLRPGGHMLLLFEVETPSWRGGLWERILPFAHARLVPESVYGRFPRQMSFDRFTGPMGDLALIVLHKPADET